MNHPAIRHGASAVITGASVGIGFAIADRLAQEGMNLILLDNNAATLAHAKQLLLTKYPERVLRTVCADVASDQGRIAINDAVEELGSLALLVNNAGILGKSALECAGPWHDTLHWRHIMEVNFWAVLELQSLLVPRLIEQGTPAAIINLGSKEGITTPPGNAAYSVSKAAIKVLTEQLAHELREPKASHVSAHLLIPGYTFTPMNFPQVDFLALDNEHSAKPAAPWSAAQVVRRLLDGLSRREFYIFCEDNEVTTELDQRRMQWSADDMILGRPALSRWHPDYVDQFNQYIAR